MNRFEISLENGHNTKDALETLEASYIEHVLKLNRFNQLRTALALGISRGTVRTKLKQYFGTKYIS